MSDEHITTPRERVREILRAELGHLMRWNDAARYIDEAIGEIIAEEREACAAELQSLLDGDFCGSDVEALRAGIGQIRGRGQP